MVFKKGWSKKDKPKEEAPKVEFAAAIPSPELPKTIAFSVEREKGLWRLIISEIQGDRVTSRKVTECENRSHALERFKIKFAEHYFIGK